MSEPRFCDLDRMARTELAAAGRLKVKLKPEDMRALEDLLIAESNERRGLTDDGYCEMLEDWWMGRRG